MLQDQIIAELNQIPNDKLADVCDLSGLLLHHHRNPFDKMLV